MTDMLFGGIGGAIAASVITIIVNLYLDSLNNKEQATAKIEIAEAKNQVVQQIIDSRSEETRHVLNAISMASNAEIRAKQALETIRQSLEDISSQKKQVDAIVSSIEEGSSINVSAVVEAIRPSVLEAVNNQFKSSVVPFALAQCPDGWKEYAPAYGRFVRGIDRGDPKIDPDGERQPGGLQNDAFKSHSHPYPFPEKYSGGSGNSLRTKYHTPLKKRTDPAGGSETRPNNVALLYCQRDL